MSEGDLPVYKGQLCKWLCIEARPVLQSVVKFEGVPSARTLIICMILHVNCTYGFILVFPTSIVHYVYVCASMYSNVFVQVCVKQAVRTTYSDIYLQSCIAQKRGSIHALVSLWLPHVFCVVQALDPAYPTHDCAFHSHGKPSKPQKLLVGAVLLRYPSCVTVEKDGTSSGSPHNGLHTLVFS